MSMLFISDLHLQAERPEIGEHFLAFLDSDARLADALYVLGDLFEVWIGDDDPNPYYASMKSALCEVADAGVPTYFMHGNRDFLIGETFAQETGMSILNDPVLVNLYGTSVLLSHGDVFCTDDVQYQKARAMTRDPQWQTEFRDKPIEERIAISIDARQQSLEYGKALDDEIADVNGNAIVEVLREYDAEILLHGHTHKPAVHEVDLGERLATRIVLGDWFEQGSVVRWDVNGPRLESLPRSN